MTPQTLRNDLMEDTCDALDIILLVIGNVGVYFGCNVVITRFQTRLTVPAGADMRIIK
jgi:hypothetical protein